MQVSRVGDGDAQHTAREPVRDRDDALQHMQRNLLGSVSRDARQSQVDEGDLVADGERAGDPLGRGDTLVDDRLRERAVARPAAHERELIWGDQAGCGEQVDDELGHRVDRNARAETLRAGRSQSLCRSCRRYAVLTDARCPYPSFELSAGRAGHLTVTASQARTRPQSVVRGTSKRGS